MPVDDANTDPVPAQDPPIKDVDVTKIDGAQATAIAETPISYQKVVEVEAPSLKVSDFEFYVRAGYLRACVNRLDVDISPIKAELEGVLAKVWILAHKDL